MEKARKILSQQMQHVFIEQADVFVKRDVHAVKESKKRFELLSDKVDVALERYNSKRPPQQSTNPVTTKENLASS